MFCRKCGNQLYDTDLFCNRCGAPVNPDPSELQPSKSAVGLTPAAKDSERIIEEFYKSNRRKEETQSILDMEFAAISGEPVDLRDLSAYTYRGREDYAAPQVTFRPAPQFEDLFEDAKRQEAEAAPAQVVEPVAEPIVEPIIEPIAEQEPTPVVENVVAPTPIPVEIVVPLEEVAEPVAEVETVAEPVAEEVVEPVAEEVAEVETVAEHVAEEVVEPVAEEVVEPAVEVEETIEEVAPVEVAVEEITEEVAPVEVAVEETSEVTPEDMENKYTPTEEDIALWEELFPYYEPTLLFDPPEYILYEMSETAPTEVEPQSVAKEEAPISQVEPVQMQTPTPVETPDLQVEPSPMQNLQVEPSPMPTFDAQKSSINKEAQATLDMLDQLFADFDKPIADSVGASAGYTAAGFTAPTYTAPTYATPTYAAPSYAAPTYTAQPSNEHAADLDKYAPATASGIATGKAIQKAVLDPEEEPPEEGFEDDEDFEDAPDTSENSDAKSADAATAGSVSDGKSDGKSDATKSDKKEKRGLFRRKSKEEPEVVQEEEEEEKSNIQKRSNVIVLNPEFLNADEKASGKGTEDFKIASNMTHGVRAMDRAMPRDYEEEEEYYEPRRGGNVLRKVMMGILTALLALAAVISILITFGRDTTAGQAVLNFWDNIKGIVSEEQDEPASEAELNEDVDATNENAGENSETNAGENSGTNTGTNTGDNSGTNANENENENGEPIDNSENENGEPTDNPENENGEPAENSDNPDNSEEPADDVLRIVNENFNAAEGGFGEAVQEPELVMAPGVFYSLDGFHDSHIFSDSEWYQDENGESVTTNAAIFYTVSDYYDKLIARMNRDSEEVLELILPDTKLMTDVSGIRADAIVLHAITKLEIGEARTNDDNYYVIVRINEATNDGRPASTYKRVLRLVPDNEEHTFKVAEVVVGD